MKVQSLNAIRVASSFRMAVAAESILRIPMPPILVPKRLDSVTRFGARFLIPSSSRSGDITKRIALPHPIEFLKTTERIGQQILVLGLSRFGFKHLQLFCQQPINLVTETLDLVETFLDVATDFVQMAALQKCELIRDDGLGHFAELRY